MKYNYKIYENPLRELPESNHKCAEQMILEKIQQEQCGREIVRPKIKVWKDVLKLVISVVITIAVLLLLHRLFQEYHSAVFVLLCVFLEGIWCVFNLKKLLLTLIILYQKYAPEKVRSACLFEPCCSEYMKRAIGKYGVFTGIFKGIKRIFRCRYPNGGIDEP